MMQDHTQKVVIIPHLWLRNRGGRELYPFKTISPDSEVRYQGHGYLDLAFTDDENVLTGKFFANDGSTKDSFTITRQSSNPPPA